MQPTVYVTYSMARKARKRRGTSGLQLGDDVVRAMVLQGAAKVFAARGVRSTGVEDILQASRISRRTFYRVYESKEDVLLALYRLGTEALLHRCRVALEQEADPLRQAERCIDAHLQTASAQARLVFVLGGEAHRQESLLNARRIEVHEALASMMASRARETFPKPLDTLLFQGNPVRARRNHSTRAPRRRRRASCIARKLRARALDDAPNSHSRHRGRRSWRCAPSHSEAADRGGRCGSRRRAVRGAAGCARGAPIVPRLAAHRPLLREG